jgi:hypothetical protein
MTENILTIIFGCLATVLAITGIILACFQFRAHIRHSANDATPSVIENAPSLELTTPDQRRLASGRSHYPSMLQIMIFDGLILASVSHCARLSTCYTYM